MFASWKSLLSITLAVGLTVVPAWIEGNYTRRWGVAADLATAGQRVDDLPKSFGPWEFIDRGNPLAPSVISELGIEGYTSRIYRNRGTGQTVEMLLMVGEPGPLVRHPPNICYANQNNRQMGSAEMIQVGGQPASELRLLRFQRESSVVRDQFMVAYSYTTNGVWQAPAVPRLVFGGEPLLYKVQALTPKKHGSPSVDLDGLKDFLASFVSTFSRQLSAE